MNESGNEARLMEMQGRLCRALSEPKRIGIIYALADRERSVGELAEAVGASLTNVSQHLTVLRGCGMVRSRKDGTSVLYSLTDPKIMEACRALREVIKTLIGDRELLLDRPRQG
ncbi:MAG TPA: metalloregulator ArsR/SmtB family transcription factor [Chloroflexota bacterium]|nr:metalloregulator ArsR/SmtB family transcription factor [Chloroflexota bacterium]